MSAYPNSIKTGNIFDISKGQWCESGIFHFNFGLISHLFAGLSFSTLSMYSFCGLTLLNSINITKILSFKISKHQNYDIKNFFYNIPSHVNYNTRNDNDNKFILSRLITIIYCANQRKQQLVDSSKVFSNYFSKMICALALKFYK